MIIRNSESTHSSPTFMVRNHAEIIRRKAWMVVNYKQQHLYGYFLSYNERLINANRGKRFFRVWLQKWILSNKAERR